MHGAILPKSNATDMALETILLKRYDTLNNPAKFKCEGYSAWSYPTRKQEIPHMQGQLPKESIFYDHRHTLHACLGWPPRSPLHGLILLYCKRTAAHATITGCRICQQRASVLNWSSARVREKGFSLLAPMPILHRRDHSDMTWCPDLDSSSHW